MKKYKKQHHMAVSTIALSCSLACLMFSSAMAQKVGVNSAISGEVMIDGDEAIEDDDIELGQEVDSGADSALQILLLDETVFTVGEETLLTIDEFVYDPNKSAGEMAASVARGTFRFMSGNTADDVEDVQIDTPVASMGVRGTIIEGAIGQQAIELAAAEGLNITGAGDAATIIMLRGPGRNSNSLNKRGAVDVRSGGQTRTLRTQGTALFVPQSGNIIGPFDVSDNMWRFMSGKLRTSPSESLERAMPPIDNASGETNDDLFDASPDPFDPRGPENVLDWPTTVDGEFDDNFDDF